MKTRLLIALILSTFGIALAASPAMAQKPIPPIKQTAEFKSLKRYVGFLQERRDTPVSPARKARYVQTLAERREKASTKVLALFGRKIMRLAGKDDRWQRREIRNIRRNQKRKVQALKGEQAHRIDVLQSRQAAATQRIQDRYAPKITRLAVKRDRLRRKLAKTTNPDKRAALNRKIRRLQNQINDLADARDDEISDVVSRYGQRISAVNDLFDARIAKARRKAKRQIAQTKRAWRKTFRTQLKAAKARRDTQKGLVKDLARRGTGYINQMPPVI